MNLRERFIETMINWRNDISPPKWEFGYWGETVDNWYLQGLQKKSYPKIPDKISTPTASLYNPAWKSIKGENLPAGIAITAGGIPFPTQSFPMDDDVKDILNLDKNQILVNINLLFHPLFDIEIIAEDEETLIYVDIDGVTRKFIKDTGVIPTGIEWVIKDWKSWEKLKKERLNLNEIRGRFPSNWNELKEKYKARDYPLVLGGYPYGYFGTLAHIMGYERLFYMYYDEPKLIHDIQKTFTELWIAVYSEVLSEIEVDYFFIWEDVSSGSGSMISPATINEFMVPYYTRLTGFLKERGVKLIFVDTDGDCLNIIPLFIKGGINGLLPIEVSCGMNLFEVRKHFPNLRIMGGIPKFEITYGKKKIDQILEIVTEVLKYGGYIPFGDHLIPPNIHWSDFKYYREKLNDIIESMVK